MSHGSVQRLISTKTRHLTASFNSEHELTVGILELAQATSTLESLALVNTTETFEDYNKVPNRVVNYWLKTLDTDLDTNLFDEKRIITSKLTIRGQLPLTFGPEVFDMSKLTRLAIFNCDLARAMSLCHSPDLENLTHFTLYAPSHVTMMYGRVFEKMLRRNHGLQHLCLHFPGLTEKPLEPPGLDEYGSNNIASSYLWWIRENLKTLSLFDDDCMRTNDEKLLSNPSLEFICSEFTALKQLGFRAPELQYKSPSSRLGYRHEFVLKYLVRFSPASLPLL